MPDWYWLHEDHSVSIGPDASNSPAFKVYSNWLYGNTNGVPNRRIAFTQTVSGVEVSTIFLGLDHRHRHSLFHIPVLFETGIYKDNTWVVRARYSTWDEAIKDHERCVKSYGGPIIPEPVTAPGAREYDEIMQVEEISNRDK